MRQLVGCLMLSLGLLIPVAARATAPATPGASVKAKLKASTQPVSVVFNSP